MSDEEKLVKAGMETVLKPITDLIEKIAGPAAEEIGLTLQDHIKVFRMRRQLRLLTKVNEMMQEANVKPRRVPLKILFPILEHGSMEESDDLQDKWAALLANCIRGDSTVLSYFPRILSELNHLEVLFLETADEYVGQGNEPGSDFFAWTLDGAIDRWYEKLREEGDRSGNDELVFDHLIGLGLLYRYQKKMPEGGYISNELSVIWHYKFTVLGESFVQACKRPRRYQAGIEATQGGK